MGTFSNKIFVLFPQDGVTDGLVVRAGVSVTWNVLSWSGGHEFEPWSGRTWDAWYFCPKLYLNQKYPSFLFFLLFEKMITFCICHRDSCELAKFSVHAKEVRCWWRNSFRFSIPVSVLWKSSLSTFHKLWKSWYPTVSIRITKWTMMTVSSPSVVGPTLVPLHCAWTVIIETSHIPKGKIYADLIALYIYMNERKVNTSQSKISQKPKWCKLYISADAFHSRHASPDLRLKWGSRRKIRCLVTFAGIWWHGDLFS